jgi:rod shape-determining protein MreC
MKGKFRKNRKRILFLILIGMSLAAILSDISGTFAQTPIGEVLLRISYPFVKLADIIREGAQRIGAAVFEANRLKEENKSLKEQLAQMTLQKALMNSQINTLEKSLSFNNFYPVEEGMYYKILPAKIIGHGANPWAKTVLIDKGTRQGIRREQTVMNESGIVGVIQEATYDMARVHLLIDQRSAVTVRIRETGEMGVLYGAGDTDYFLLETEGISRRLRRNDHAITAGLQGSLFPGNILIGTVEKVERDKYGRTKAQVKPSINFDTLDVIFIILGSERQKEKAFEDNF